MDVGLLLQTGGLSRLDVGFGLRGEGFGGGFVDGSSCQCRARVNRVERVPIALLQGRIRRRSLHAPTQPYAGLQRQTANAHVKLT